MSILEEHTFERFLFGALITNIVIFFDRDEDRELVLHFRFLEHALESRAPFSCRSSNTIFWTVLRMQVNDSTKGSATT
jgi:hypothetical protein